MGVVSAALVLRERGLGSGPVAASLRGVGELFAPPDAAVEPGAARRPRDRRRRRAHAVRRALTPTAPRRRPPTDRSPTGGPTPGGSAITAVVHRPGRVLALAAVLAVAGWVADTQTAVQSDVTKLVPSTMPALRNLNTLEKVTGVSGEIDVTVRGANVASPSTLKWMIGYENGLLAHYGYVEEKGCAQRDAVPGAVAARPVLDRQPDRSASANLSQTQINTLLNSVPAYFSQAVLTGDRREATLAFGIRLMPLAAPAAGDRLHALAAASRRPA